MKQPHIVPLPTQAVALLKELHRSTGRGRYVFPSARGPHRPLSDNGAKSDPHTILDEMLNYRVDYIEHQLAHAVRDANGRAYNRTAHLKGRRDMMQGWADYLDNLKKQAKAGNVITAEFGGKVSGNGGREQ